MQLLIKVQPARALRVAFARWAVTQTPKVRTTSEIAFGVPAALFPRIPEDLLAGALVDGQPYTPAEAMGEPIAAPTPEQGEERPQPPEPPSELDPAASPLPVPFDGAPGEQGQHSCPDCGRLFTAARGLAAHRRQAHAGVDD